MSQFNSKSESLYRYVNPVRPCSQSQEVEIMRNFCEPMQKKKKSTNEAASLQLINSVTYNVLHVLLFSVRDLKSHLLNVLNVVAALQLHYNTKVNVYIKLQL